MKKLIVGICLLVWLTSCGGGKKQTTVQEEDMVSVESMEIVADSLLAEDVVEEPEVPVSAD